MRARELELGDGLRTRDVSVVVEQTDRRTQQRRKTYSSVSGDTSFVDQTHLVASAGHDKDVDHPSSPCDGEARNERPRGDLHTPCASEKLLFDRLGEARGSEETCLMGRADLRLTLSASSLTSSCTEALASTVKELLRLWLPPSSTRPRITWEGKVVSRPRAHRSWSAFTMRAHLRTAHVSKDVLQEFESLVHCEGEERDVPLSMEDESASRTRRVCTGPSTYSDRLRLLTRHSSCVV